MKKIKKGDNMSLSKPKLEPGVITGKKLLEVLEYAKENKFAFPAVNVIGSNTINAALEAAKEAKSVIMIQFPMVELIQCWQNVGKRK